MYFRKTGFYIILALLILPFIITHLWMFIKIWPWPDLIPESLGIRGILYLFGRSSRSLWILLESTILSLVITIATLLVSIPAAKALAFYDFKGKRFFKVLILLPVIVPMVTVAMGIHAFFIRLSLANTYMGVILVHIIPGIPYGVKILMNIFEISGNSHETQGKVLGASPWQVFCHITLPIITPGLITAGSLIYIISFSQYFITFLIGGGQVVTFSMQMFPFILSGDRTMGSTYSFVFITAILIVLSISEKFVKNYYERSSISFV